MVDWFVNWLIGILPVMTWRKKKKKKQQQTWQRWGRKPWWWVGLAVFFSFLHKLLLEKSDSAQVRGRERERERVCVCLYTYVHKYWYVLHCFHGMQLQTCKTKDLHFLDLFSSLPWNKRMTLLGSKTHTYYCCRTDTHTHTHTHTHTLAYSSLLYRHSHKVRKVRTLELDWAVNPRDRCVACRHRIRKYFSWNVMCLLHIHSYEPLELKAR